MEVTSRSSHPNPAPSHPPANVLPQCPVCSGLLVPLRGSYRCSRCLFAACLDCDGETADSRAGD